jgi:hypothetical protein
MKFCFWFFLLICACSATCNAQRDAVLPHLEHQWHKIANLPPGTPILVRQFYDRRQTLCVLAWIDNSSVACDSFEGRVVYPASSILSIVEDTPPLQHRFPTGLVIATATGAIIGGIAGSNGTASDTALGVFIGAGLVGGFTAAVASEPPHAFQPVPQYGVRIPLRPPHAWFR